MRQVLEQCFTFCCLAKQLESTTTGGMVFVHCLFKGLLVCLLHFIENELSLS
jgi:hypothetical protein